MPSSDAPGALTLRQQVATLPAHVLAAWRGRYANKGMDLEARAILDREAATVRAGGQKPDVVAVWTRLATGIHAG